MNNRSFLFPAILVLPILSACSEKQPAPTPPPPTVQVMTLKPTTVPVYKEIVATLLGRVNTAIKPKVQGYLLTQDYDDGAIVSEGELIFTIDPDTYKIAVQKSEADLDEAKAQLVKTQLTVERDKELIKADAISQKQLDNSIQAEQAAAAQVAAAEAGVANAKLNLSYTKVYSPIHGVAGKAQANVGDLVGPADTLTMISNLDPIQAVFYIPEKAYLERGKDLRKILDIPFDKREPSIELIFGDGTVYDKKGRLQFIDRQIDEGTGTIALYALFPNPGDILRPGQYVMIRARTTTIEKALLIPQRALSETQGMFSAFVVNKDNVASSVPVERGLTQGSDVVITSGLKAGDSVIIEGIQKATSGSKVTPQPWTPSKTKGSDSDDSSSDNSDSSSSDDSDAAPSGSSTEATPKKGDSE